MFMRYPILLHLGFYKMSTNGDDALLATELQKITDDLERSIQESDRQLEEIKRQDDNRLKMEKPQQKENEKLKDSGKNY